MVLTKQKGFAPEVIFESLEAALLQAYRKEPTSNPDAYVVIDRETGVYKVMAKKQVVETVELPETEISLLDARKKDKRFEIGDVVEVDVTPANFGRSAAHTAKQMLIQRLKEAERSVVYEEYYSREGDIITGVITRVEGKNVFIDLGKTEAILPPTEQIATETYREGDRIKCYIVEVKKTTKGPQIMISRTHPGLLKRLFELEVPEIFEGVVELKSVAREPGMRSKIAVYSRDENIDPVGACVSAFDEPVIGAYGRMAETSTGKDTTSGHWEMMGHPVTVPFPTFYDGFPKELMDAFIKETGYGFLGNEVASGTEIIERLGEEHIRTGKPIVYTSADSVFQIAAHEDIIPLEDLYRMCQITRDKVCVGDYYVGRIIARPFVGTPGHFVRTSNRHDYSRMPEKKMVQQELQDANIPTVAVGKIGDIYAHVGWDASYPTKSNAHGMNVVPYLLGQSFTRGFMMVNLVEFDSLYGHRRNVEGYKRAIEDFDYQLGGLLDLLKDDDLLLITADHGNDPTWKGTDHTREMVPLLAYSPSMSHSVALGDRHSFTDIGETVLQNFGLKQWGIGSSFLNSLKV